MTAITAEAPSRPVSKIRRFAIWQSDWYKQIIALVLFILLFQWSFQSMSMALALIVSMYLHELAHAQVFERNGIKAFIGLVFPLGAIAMPTTEEEDRRSDQLPWYTIGWLTLVGPMANVGLMLIGAAIEQFESPFTQFGHDMVYINGILAISNLLPVWKLDAGQLFHVIFSSLSEKYDKMLSWILSLLVILGTAMVMFNNVTFTQVELLVRALLHVHWLVIFVVIVCGIWYAQGHDNHEHANSPQRMTWKQALVLTGTYALTFLVAMTLSNAF